MVVSLAALNIQYFVIKEIEFWFEVGYHLSRNQNSLVLRIDHE